MQRTYFLLSSIHPLSPFLSTPPHKLVNTSLAQNVAGGVARRSNTTVFFLLAPCQQHPVRRDLFTNLWYAVLSRFIKIIMITGCLMFLSQPEAHAGKFDETLDFSLHGTGGTTDFTGIILEPGEWSKGLTNPGDIGLRLSGEGKMFLGTIRGNISMEGVRIGLGFGFMRSKDLKISHHGMTSPREERGRMSTSTMILSSEIFVAYAIGDPRGVRPYIEVRGTWMMFRSNVETTDCQSGCADLRDYTGHVFGIVPRIGLLISINQYFFADLGASYGVVGPEEFAFSLGVGIPIPFSNL